MSSHSNWSWEEMIAAFRALGGTIENVRMGTGPRGRGLFSVDMTRPVLLRLPENLLFASDDVEFVGTHMRLKDAAPVGKAEREFFEKYEEGFSWGAGARETWTAFETALEGLPGDIRGILGTEFGMARRFDGDPAERAGTHFLGSRQIGWKDKVVIAPVIELAKNGEEGLEYNLGDDISFEGVVAGEILVSFGAHDPLSLFFSYGHASRALGAFSLPMKMNVGPNQLTIGRDTDSSVQRGNYLVPELVQEGPKILLSHLMLGHAPYPAVPRGIFRALTKEIFGADTDEVFDSVRHFNRTKFLLLLTALERYHGPMIAALSKMARFQLEALSWSIGSVDLYASLPPRWDRKAARHSMQIPAPTGFTWETMLDAFRELGGVADNIRLAYGTAGRGIFPARRDTPVRLRVPQNLLFPVSDIVFDNGEIGIKAESSVGAREREFFAAYQDAFSWGGGGQEQAAAFVAGFESLPADARELLTAEFGMGDIFEGEPAKREQNRFLRSRMVDWHGRIVLVPLVELINQRPDGIPFDRAANFLGIEGKGGGEIFVSYRSADAFQFFRQFGSASSEPGAFSLPMKTKVGPFELIIERNIVLGVARGVAAMPQLRRDQNRLVLSFLPLGNPDFPRMSRGIFHGLMRNADVTADEADEVFDRILHFNRAAFVGLLDALASHGGKAVVALRKMARFQLEAMSWCIGSREV